MKQLGVVIQVMVFAVAAMAAYVVAYVLYLKRTYRR